MKAFWKKNKEQPEKLMLYLIRHGQTDWNIQGKIQGSHDIPLNDTGKHQAELLAKGMDCRPVDKIFSSPLVRAVETAKGIAQRQNVDVYLVPGLIEVEFGQWEGMTWEEIKKQYPEEHARWEKNPVDVAPPGGETQMQVLERIAASVEAILANSRDCQSIAVVSHGAALAYVVAYLMRNHPSDGEIIVENVSITTLEYDRQTEDFTMIEVNDTSHLAE